MRQRKVRTTPRESDVERFVLCILGDVPAYEISFLGWWEFLVGEDYGLIDWMQEANVDSRRKRPV